jgi:hypothetical protein
MKLYIDDIRPLPDDSWTLARTYDEAISLIEQHGDAIEVVSFDHDLGDWGNGPVERTGYTAVLHVVQMKMDGKPIPKSFRVHSANPVGCERMLGVINRYLV